jgi:hypothetical protein
MILEFNEYSERESSTRTKSIMVEYLENFKIPVDFLNKEMQKTGLTNRVSDSKLKSLGFEFFTNSSCLLLSQDKVEWLRSKI